MNFSNFSADTLKKVAGLKEELAQFFPLKDMGGVVTKSVMSKARAGRPTPRMAETPSGMLNSIGLQGPGIDAFLAKDVPFLVEQIFLNHLFYSFS